MDILTHTLSGVALGTAVAGFVKTSFNSKLKIVLVSGIAAALPDIDAISLWSKFDATIGSFFNLAAKGKNIYSAKYWYSHHAFMHSITAALLFTGILALLCYWADAKFKHINNPGIGNFLRRKQLLLTGCFLGFVIHLVEDMPTPASSWGGVNLFWPTNIYIGGTGEIWWWNNYDIFLIVVAVIIINLLLHLAARLLHFNIKKLTLGVFIIGVALVTLQVKTRNFNFAYSNSTTKYTQYEATSKQLQKDILGERLYRIMEKLDNKLSIYF